MFVLLPECKPVKLRTLFIFSECLKNGWWWEWSTGLDPVFPVPKNSHHFSTLDPGRSGRCVGLLRVWCVRLRGCCPLVTFLPPPPTFSRPPLILQKDGEIPYGPERKESMFMGYWATHPQNRPWGIPCFSLLSQLCSFLWIAAFLFVYPLEAGKDISGISGARAVWLWSSVGQGPRGLWGAPGSWRRRHDRGAQIHL